MRSGKARLASRTAACGKAARIAVFALFVCLLTGLFHGVGFAPEPVMALVPSQTYTIRSAEDLADYSREYATGNRNPQDVLVFSINSGSYLSGTGFISIGTEEQPFAGTLNVPTAGIDTFLLLECPLFNYVSTDLKITGAGTVKIMREAAEENPPAGVLTSGSLFANHVVVAGESSAVADWSIALVPYEAGGDASASFDSLIGDIAADAHVKVAFHNTSDLGVTGTGDVGLICGALGAGAKLEVGTSGSGSALTVSTTGGNAGGLVGRMSNGSTLKFNSDNHSRVTSVTSTTAYAGGIVGYANNITVEYKDGVTDYTVSGSVTGKNGAGGLFGYYKNTAASFGMADTYNITSGMTVSATTYAGGVFGLLENTGASFTFNGNASGSEVLTVVLSGGTSRGGVCGGYLTNALTNTFAITNTAPTVRSVTATNVNSGGLIGSVKDTGTGTAAAYLDISDVSVTVGSGTLSGGLIGTMGSLGSFADVSGAVTLSGSMEAGMIGSLPEGVLRIQGTTDLSGSTITKGQFVNARGHALVYALGDGSGTTGTHGNWLLKRNHLSNYVDDINSWGQVIRTDGTILAEGDLFTVDGSAHTVTVTAPVTAMATVTDFAKTALNIKLNESAGTGALQFASATRSATLLASALSISADIDLRGTGILGFARDDGHNNAYSGTFSGGGHSITLAIGEQYGVQSDGSTALAVTNRQGNIYTHFYNGLFAKTNNATVQNLTLPAVSGNDSYAISIYQKAGDTTTMRVGAIAAQATGTLTLTSDTVAVDCNIKVGGDYAIYFGGAVGEANGSVTVTVTNGSYKPDVTDKTAAETAAGSYYTYVGGVIGYVNAAAGQSITMNGCTVGLTYNKPDNAHRASCFGSAIAKIANKAYVKGSRTVTLTSVTTDLTVTNGRSDSGKKKKFGGILGTEWFSADVTLNGVTLGASVASSATTGVGYGGLVQIATGYWNIQDIEVDSVNFNLPNQSSQTFGFVANRTWTGEGDVETALYLEIDSTGSHYDIDAMTFTGTPTLAVFDEIVASSRVGCTVLGADGTAIGSNGNSIVSIKTSGNIITTATVGEGDPVYNTYQNQTAYGTSGSNREINANTRYYYNIAYARANTATAKYNFLVWTVRQYAHASLATWFPASSTFTGNLDMTGLSYYPVDLTGAVTFSNVSCLKLDNNLMENWVKTAYTDKTTRSTRSSNNQHYLMHTAIFRNVTADITVTTGMTLEGNVPKMSDSFCGFLIAGQIGGSDTTSYKFNAANLTLAGVYVSNEGEYWTNTTYAPLLINKIGKNTSLTIAGAAQADDTAHTYSSIATAGEYAASSLIGDVGNSTASGIYLTFSGMKLDGRTNTTDPGNLTTQYGTSKSVFSRATFLNSFLYFRESAGKYTFTIEDDWGTGTAVHNVTYGREITSSLENVDLQKNYYRSESYTHRSVYEAASADDFSTGFLPYVYVGYVQAENKHEIEVNIYVDTAPIKGCGKYDDPFIIDNGNKLVTISKMINNPGDADGKVLDLPSDLSYYKNGAGTEFSTTYDYTATIDPSTSAKYVKHTYTINTTNVTSANGGTARSHALVQQYLAGAYYKITENIILDSGFKGLGNNSVAKFAFRGVLLGASENTTVTNQSTYPLVYTSLGCVIKDLTVVVAVDDNGSHAIPLSAPSGSLTFNYSSGVSNYGALIGQIFGGDTFIDRVRVSYDANVTFSVSVDDSAKYPRLVPIGGYVGVLLNGGLIFRNMIPKEAAQNGGVEDLGFIGLTSATVINVKNSSGVTTSTVNVSNTGYLYVNPIIGRVITGYAFYEGNAVHETEETSTLKNGSKNYSISDLSVPETDAEKLDMTSGNAVTVPDGRAMYILAAIVNSGAGSASSAGAAYADLGFWGAYGAHTVARGGSTYNTVGSTDDTEDAYTNACLDSYTTDRIKTPYIIRTYTRKYVVSTVDTYYARCLAVKDLTITLSGHCDIPAGFRGIGSIYSNSGDLQPTVTKMTSKKVGDVQNVYTVTLHMDYREYNHLYVTSYIPVASNSSNAENTAGFGLFNRLNMNSASESNSIQYLTLSGRVFYDVYKVADGNPATYKMSTFGSNDRTEASAINSDTEDITFRRNILSVGGLAGYVCAKAYVRNVTFNNLSVEGAKTAGGLIGFIHLGDSSSITVTIDYTEGVTNAGWVNVVGGQQAGGLIGRIYRAVVNISGVSGGTDLIIKNIESKNSDPNEAGMYYFANINTGVGGVVGTCWASDKTNNGSSGSALGTTYTLQTGIKSGTTKKVSISNINVVKGESDANVCVLHDGDAKYNYAGGFVGSAHNTYVKIEDCNLRGVNVSANTAGGFVGKVTQKYYLEILGCSANGNGKTASISGRRFAGGAVGWAIGRDTLYFQLLNFSIEGYTIQSTTTGENIAGAGGALGYAQGNNKSLKDDANYICQFNNLTVLNCAIITNYTSSDTDPLPCKCGTGGLIGVIDTIIVSDGDRNPSENNRTEGNKYKFSGYNILIKNCTLTHLEGGDEEKDYSIATGEHKNRKIGDLVGNNAVRTPLKLVGVSVENSGYRIDDETNGYCGKHVGYYDSDDDNFGTSGGVGTFGEGYAVFANFNAITGGTALANVGDTNTSDDDYTPVPAAAPYATVNPATTIGNVYSGAVADAGGKYVRCSEENAEFAFGGYFYKTWVDEAGQRYSLTEVPLVLTGDGVAANTDVLAIQNILRDTASGKYKYAASANYNGESGETNFAAFSGSVSKLVMFSSETRSIGYLGTDFPVLILDDTNPDNAHRMINSYLRLLTNTKHNFGVDGGTEYKVVIYNMVYNIDDDVFLPSASGASLRLTNNRFNMSRNSFDSNKLQFSLIDVRFYDPADPANYDNNDATVAKVAYHLYVPVFVKKVLTYEFDIAVQSGTDYLRSTYTERFGDALIENVGTPITFFFRYRYARTDGEWADAVNDGENINRNYVKKLQFTKANSNDILDDLPDDAVLVLVDPNRGGKAYYARKSDVLSGNLLDLGGFRESLTDPDSTAFSPLNLDQLLVLDTVQINDEAIMIECEEGAATKTVNGHYYRPATAAELADDSIVKAQDTMVACDGASATVFVGDQGYRRATQEEMDDDEVEKWTITASFRSGTELTEAYYISMFTESNAVNDELFHYYLVQPQSAFAETGYPSRLSSTSASMVHLVMGKIFYHDEMTVESTSVNGSEVMTESNNSLTVTMTALMGVSTELPDEIRDNMITLVAGSHVYQGFLVYLNRVEKPSSAKAILGNPDGTGLYGVDSSGEHLDPGDDTFPTPGTAYQNADISVTQNVAQFRTADLRDAFATGNIIKFRASVTLTYSAGAIPTQFPGRNNTAQDNGVWISGSSNLAFSPGTVTNSKNSISLDETPRVTYYSEAEPDIATLDLNPLSDRVGDFTPLGINAANNDGRNRETFDLYAVLNVTSISEIISGYTDASVTVTLQQKQNDGSYSDVDDIRNYFYGIEWIGIDPSSVTATAASYSVVIPRFVTDPGTGDPLTDPETGDPLVNLEDNGAEIVLPVIRCTVITGSSLESAGLTYGNYRVTVAVELRDGEGTAYPPSHAENFVVYSNVRVIPSFLTN